MSQPANRRLVTEAALADALEGFTGGDSIKVGGAGPSDGWWFDNGGVESVTAPAPIFTDKDGTASDTYTIPAATGVQYRVGGAVKAAGTYPGSGSITVTAHALSGYVLTGTASWSFTFSTATAPVTVTPTAPTASDTADTYTIPSMTGVEYLVGGVVQSAGTKTVGDVDATVTVTARAQAGYTLTGTTSWTFTFTKKPVAPLPPASAYETAVMADAPNYLLPLRDPVGATTVQNLGSTKDRIIDAQPVTFTATDVVFGTSGLWTGDTAATLNGTSSKIATGNNNNTAMTAGTLEAIIVPSAKAPGDLQNRAVVGFAKPHFHLSIEGTAPTGAGESIWMVTAWLKNVKVKAPVSLAQEVQVGKRSHIAATFDGTTVRLYLNGAEVHQSPNTTTLDASWRGLTVGHLGEPSFAGNIAEPAWYLKALTPAQILAHAKAAGLA